MAQYFGAPEYRTREERKYTYMKIINKLGFNEILIFM